MRKRAARRASWKFGFSQETSPSVFHRSHFLSPSASQKKSPADIVEGVEEFLPGDAGGAEFADDDAGATIRIKARRFRLHENGNFQLMRGAEDAVGEVVGDETFVVVGKHERVEMPECGKKQTQESFLGFRAERFAAFVIHANNLLVASNDASFYRGDALRIAYNSFVRDACNSQASVQSSTGFVTSNHTKRFDLSSECGDVYGDISRAAKAFTLLDEVNDGNRRFRRKARGRPPEVAIEH